MQITPIKTRKLNPPQEDLYKILDQYCPKLKDGNILLITSKILAIHQGQCILAKDIKNKDKLIKSEADVSIPRKECPGEYAILTIKNNTLIPSAGIDESNANGYYILWPKNPEKEAKKICLYLKKKFSLKKLAVIITDSHTTPLRSGTIGISIGFYGLNPLRDYRGKSDLFGRKLEVSQVNVVDSLASIATLTMGEGKECTPMALIRNAKVKFTAKETFKDLFIPFKEDIYYPLLKFFKKNEPRKRNRKN
jgi:coenzyme F420-0:L-glutamate ligase